MLLNKDKVWKNDYERFAQYVRTHAQFSKKPTFLTTSYAHGGCRKGFGNMLYGVNGLRLSFIFSRRNVLGSQLYTVEHG